MEVITYGTRGSVPVARPGVSETGGNTTCLRIVSDRIPADTALIVDAGSGIVPLAMELLKEGIKKVVLLFTHWHHDHTQGLLLTALPFIKVIPIYVYGPIQNGYGPKEVFETLFKKPYFPVDFPMVASHFNFFSFDHPQNHIMVVHPQSGVKRLMIDSFERQVQKDGRVLFSRGQSQPVDDCLVIKLHNTDHPEQTVSYRFEERPSGRVFTLLTDHESQRGFPMSLVNHLRGSHLLIQDAQYSLTDYANGKAGFGHGTPDYAVELANKVGAERLGLTHHDPMSDDDKVAAICAEAQGFAAQALELAGEGEVRIRPDTIFACTDYGRYLV
jgi:phosphoribosyl 1,2-cyclic phosphodiesterase